MKIFYQGVAGAFSHKAAERFAAEYATEPPELVSAQSFPKLFELLESEPHGLAAVPIENSSIGPIGPVWEQLWSTRAKVVCQLAIPVRLQLIGLEGAQAEELTEVRSHPAALAQCRNLFNKYANLRPIETFDTAGAVREIVTTANHKIAAIAAQDALLPGTMVLNPDIQDYPNNATKFALLSMSQWACAQHPEPGSYMFTLITDRGTMDSRLREAVATSELENLTVFPEPKKAFARRLVLELKATYEELIFHTEMIELGRFCRHN